MLTPCSRGCGKVLTTTLPPGAGSVDRAERARGATCRECAEDLMQQAAAYFGAYWGRRNAGGWR